MKKHSYMSFILPAIAMVLTCSCDKIGADNREEYKEYESITLTKAEQKVADATNAFGWEAYHTLYEDKQVLVSPLSLSLAFSMTAIGADGNTAAEMRSTLGFEGCSTEDMNSFYQKMVSALDDIDSRTTFEVANSIWASQDIRVKHTFIEAAEEYYDSEVMNVDFRKKSTLKEINGWCSDNTHGKIKKILDELDPSTKMALINALYFNGEWAYEFDAETDKGSFTTIGGSSTKVDMMNLHAGLDYAEYDGYRMVTLPYGNGAFSMSVILPEEGVSFKEEAAGLDAEVWAGLLSASKGTEVVVKLPKFSFEYETGLKDALLAMGMKDAFNPDRADFSGISDTPLFISEAKQKTFIDVNTKGTEAAAITYIGILETSIGPDEAQPVVFTADRPFMFVIHEKSTGAILFLGQKVS